MTTESDEQLVRRCEAGEYAAFEILVRRYQVLVCSIAYSMVGSIASSEDVGQEAFLSAWKRLGNLDNPQRFKSWLSTITRNEARAWLRRRVNSMQQLEEPAWIPESTSEEEVVNQEEADLVWTTLSRLPESYREPLVLYYRHDQSVSEVADALSLSQSATKQRLARGRELLRSEVLAAIEQGLRKSAPTAAFTFGVMAVISGTSKTAAAAAGTVTAGIATSAAKTAAGGAAAGSLIGMCGAFAGTFASWYNAEYQSQRRLIVTQSTVYAVGMTIFCLPFIAMQFGWRPTETFGVQGYKLAHAVWMLVFLALNGIWMGWSIWSYQKLQRKERNAATERLPRYQKAQAEGVKVTGRRWTSQIHFLRSPLIQIAFPDIEVGIEEDKVARQGTARAWIAIGHIAYGRAVAVGHRAIAPLAFGTQAVGIVACGVFSIGMVSFGVLSVAPLAAGVITLGFVSLGGAIAAGYLAVAPMAFGLKAAKGAMVFSCKFAEGPAAFAPHANDEVARQFMASSATILRLDQWLQQLATPAGQSQMRYWVVAIIIVVVLAQRLVLARAKQ